MQTPRRHRGRIAPWCLLLVASLPGAAGAQETVGASASPPHAFVGVHVVPMDRDTLLHDRTVIVEGDRIVRIGPADGTPIPQGADRIEAPGAYLLPGLVDAHVHAVGEAYPLYVVAGVTTVRVTMGSPERLAERARLAAEPSLPWPNLVITGPLLAGEEVPWPHEIVESPEEATRLVGAHAEAGYDALKVYDGLTRPVYEAIVEGARARGIPFVGHVPLAVGLERAIEAGQATIEHAEQLVYAAFGRDEVMTQPLERLAEIVAVFRRAEVTPCVTPTLRGMALAMRRGTAFTDSVDAGLDWSLVDPALTEWWTSYRTPAPPEALERRSRFLALQERLTADLQEAGVTLLAGTDTPYPFLIPGRSLLDEVDALANAGLSRHAALAAATRNAGRCLEGDDMFGVVAEGARADLLLVAEDPRAAPATLRDPLGVMVRGTWFDRDGLHALEATVREGYAGE